MAIAILAAACALSQMGPDIRTGAWAQTTQAPRPPQFDVRPDYAGMADNFLSGITGWSPEMLGQHLDARALADIGISVSSGNYADASAKTLRFLGEKAIGNIPVIGQWYALGQLGQGLGNWAIDHFGSARFDSAFQSLSSHFSETDWNRAYGDPNLDVELVIVENANLLTFIDKQSGGGHSPEELRRMLWDMLRAKHQFESLADHYGLAGAERTYDALSKRYEEDMRVTAEVARMVEADRVAAETKRLADEWRKEQEWKEKQAAEEKARIAETCNAWLGKIPFDEDHHLPKPADDVVEELCGERPPAPALDSNDAADDTTPDTTVDAAPLSPDQAADYSPNQGVSGDLTWTVTASEGGRQTTFKLTVTNSGSEPMTGVGISASANGAYKSGGVIAGASRSTLAPGQSRTFDIIATGDVPGVAIALLNATGTIATVIRPCNHETGINADGHYAGVYSGLGNDGEITLRIAGRKVTGTLSGGYADDSQALTISCSINGSYDPDTGSISAEWGGVAIGAYKGENGGKINEQLAGSLNGSLNGESFSGTWAGGSEYMEADGKWSASR